MARDYGNAADKWPIQFGEVWRAGPHIVACGDLEQGMGRDLLTTYSPLALAYVDPPWGPGLAKRFRKVMDDPTQPDYDNLTMRVVEFAASAGEAWLEMGYQWVEHLEAVVRALKGTVVFRYPIIYNRTGKGCLVRASWEPQPRPLADDPSGMDDLQTPAWVIERLTQPGDLVGDCCLGLGLTGRACELTGRRLVGMELNPRRAAHFLQWMARRGETPRKVGIL